MRGSEIVTSARRAQADAGMRPLPCARLCALLCWLSRAARAAPCTLSPIMRDEATYDDATLGAHKVEAQRAWAPTGTADWSRFEYLYKLTYPSLDVVWGSTSKYLILKFDRHLLFDEITGAADVSPPGEGSMGFECPCAPAAVSRTAGHSPRAPTPTHAAPAYHPAAGRLRRQCVCVCARTGRTASACSRRR